MVYVSATILKTAKNTGLPIILGAQINREGANSDGKTIPQLHNLKESGSLEEDANNVWAVFCPPLQTTATIEMEVHILKNREGDTGEPIKLKWNRPEWKID
jgi:replicative DNA helicase